MAKVKATKLDELMSTAGVPDDIRANLRAANEGRAPAKQPRSRGHGAPAPDKTPMPSI